jgi:hypothetical protein
MPFVMLMPPLVALVATRLGVMASVIRTPVSASTVRMPVRPFVVTCAPTVP